MLAGFERAHIDIVPSRREGRRNKPQPAYAIVESDKPADADVFRNSTRSHAISCTVEEPEPRAGPTRRYWALRRARATRGPSHATPTAETTAETTAVGTAGGTAATTAAPTKTTATGSATDTPTPTDTATTDAPTHRPPSRASDVPRPWATAIPAPTPSSPQPPPGP